jgi:hypothetical protein
MTILLPHPSRTCVPVHVLRKSLWFFLLSYAQVEKSDVRPNATRARFKSLIFRGLFFECTSAQEKSRGHGYKV